MAIKRLRFITGAIFGVAYINATRTSLGGIAGRILCAFKFASRIHYMCTCRSTFGPNALWTLSKQSNHCKASMSVLFQEFCFTLKRAKLPPYSQ